MSIAKRIEKILKKQYDTIFRKRLMTEWKPKTINRIEKTYLKFLEYVSNVTQFIFLLWFFKYFAEKAGFETTVIALFVLIILTIRNKLKDL